MLDAVYKRKKLHLSCIKLLIIQFTKKATVYVIKSVLNVRGRIQKDVKDNCDFPPIITIMKTF